MPRIATGCLLGTLLGLTLVASPAQAFGFGGRGSQMGDSWLNDAQKNPRFIEPGADHLPSRYRASHPREGWDDRMSAAGQSYRRRSHRAGD